MHLANPKWNCTDQKEEHFIDGITNGASWSSLSGGMQDYNYVHSNCFEITLELGCDRFPKGSDLRKHWSDNKNALMELLQQVGLVSQATHLCKKQMINFNFFFISYSRCIMESADSSKTPKASLCLVQPLASLIVVMTSLLQKMGITGGY